MKSPAPTRLALIAVLVLSAAQAASAQVVSTIKTPPLANSQSIIIPINVHIPTATPPGVGWAGAIVKAHILDASEMDIVSVAATPGFVGNLLGFGGPLSTPATGPNMPFTFLASPFGPPSNNITSVPLSANFFLPGTATASGIPVFTSTSFTVATALIHAKNTTPLNNSDIDLVAQLWNIYHTSGLSMGVTLFPSDRIWVTSMGDAPVPGGLGSPTAHWLHITNTTVATFGGPSGFFATLAETTFLGIEHVPEPATGLMLGGGLLALAGRQLRRRRLSA